MRAQLAAVQPDRVAGSSPRDSHPGQAIRLARHCLANTSGMRAPCSLEEAGVAVALQLQHSADRPLHVEGAVRCRRDADRGKQLASCRRSEEVVYASPEAGIAACDPDAVTTNRYRDSDVVPTVQIDAKHILVGVVLMEEDEEASRRIAACFPVEEVPVAFAGRPHR